MNSDIKFFDNQYVRSFSSNIYNFILDKETNVSVYWGHDENDDPLYDLIGPQELTIKVTKDTTEQDIFNKFNLLANIQEEKEQNKVYASVLDKDVEYCYNNVNLKCISTFNTLIFDCDTDTDFNIFNKVMTYIKRFNINVMLQFKDAITRQIVEKLKFICPNINLVFSETTLDSYKMLTKNKFRVDVKIHVNANNYSFLIENLKALKKDVRGKMFIDEPFVNKLQLQELENRIKNLKLIGIYLAACNLYKFNDSQDKPFKHVLEIVNCDSCCYSLYINGNDICPCQNKINTILTTISNQKNKDQIWDKDQGIKKYRQLIVDKTYCE